MHKTNKQNWKAAGNVDYICIEARPPRRRGDDDVRAQVTLDWIPAGDSGACDAFQALQTALLRCKTPDDSAKFYAQLREFADNWQ